MKSHQPKPQKQEELNSKYLTVQIKKINIFLFFLVVITGIQIAGSIFSFSQALTVTNDTNEVREQVESNDFVAYIFDNSVTSMLLSTFIIAGMGVLITKLRTFKKKLDMIEILTKSHVRLKQQADEREKKLEKRFIESQNQVMNQISDLCTKMDTKTQELENKIDEVKNEATQALIDYLSKKRR